MSETIAVVIAATDSNRAVWRCVESLNGYDRIVLAYDPQCVDGSNLPPGLICVAGEPGANAHRLRSLGLSRTTAAIIAFTEDSCILSAVWVDAWRKAFADPNRIAATGPVEIQRSPRLPIEDAVFLCEYTPFLRERGQVKQKTCRLAGNNFAIRRFVIHSDSRDIHESELAARISHIEVVSEAIAYHSRRDSLRQAIRDRLRFGFDFGRLCAESTPKRRRLSRILGGPGILLSQVGRLTFTLLRKRRGAEILLSAGLLTIALLTAWSVAEWLGWVVGPSRKRGEVAVRSPLPRIDRLENLSPDCRCELASL